MGSVRVEILPWATRIFGGRGNSRLVLEEEINEGETVEDLFLGLARRYEAFGEIVFEAAGRRLTGQITVIHNGRQLELAGGLAAKLSDGDTLLLVPSFAGGGGSTYRP